MLYWRAREGRGGEVGEEGEWGSSWLGLRYVFRSLTGEGC